MKKITALLTIGSLALAACGSSSSSNTSSSASAPASTKPASNTSTSTAANTTVASTKSTGTVQETMHDNYFGTKTITGKPGSTVKVALKNVGANEHNFKIDGQKAADADVKPGKTAAISVTIPSSGSVQFYCEYHKGLGMVGTVKSS